jgi:hypothetical protein
MQRTDNACMDESDFPLNSLDAESAAVYYGADAVAERERERERGREKRGRLIWCASVYVFMCVMCVSVCFCVFTCVYVCYMC